MSVTTGWNARRVCEMTDVSYRQLDYWIRTDLVKSSLASGRGSGHRRMFSDIDILIVFLIQAMLTAGLTHNVVRAAVAKFEHTPPTKNEILVIQSLGNRHWRGGNLEVINQTVTITSSEADVLRIISEGRPCWILKVGVPEPDSRITSHAEEDL